MRSKRLMLAVTALCAVTALSACSGSDDEEPSSNESASTKPSASDSATIYPLDGCDAEVKVSGSVSASWSGTGRATPSGGTTLYQSTHKKDWIAVTPKDGDVPARVDVTVKGTTYSATGKDAGVEAAEDGSGATVKATTQGPQGKGPKVKATFTCDQA